MATDRQKGVVLFECDGCGEVFDGEDGDFGTAWALARGAGWRVRKNEDAGRWEHYCSTCPVPR